MSHQVFICYAHPDDGYARAVCEKLESSDIRCWMAPRDISPSKDWAAEVIDGINMSNLLILLFSSHSNESPQVRREIERAVHKGINILPFRIEDVALSKSLEYFISTPHWLDAISPPFENHLDKLRECVHGLLKGIAVDCRPSPRQAVSSPGSSIPVTRPLSVPIEKLFKAQDLKYIETQLAGYLGPMAKLLVKQAAEKTSSIQELVSILANELAGESERKTFRQNCEFLNR